MNKIRVFFKTTGLAVFAFIFSIVIFMMLFFSKIFRRKKAD